MISNHIDFMRRPLLAACLCSLLAAACGSVGSATAPLEVPNPLVEGPIMGPGQPWLQSTRFDLAEVGYQRREYFISGKARGFSSDEPLSVDGHWTTRAEGSAPYKSRIVVHMPIDQERFNGTVVVEWFNVSGGLDAAPDWTFMHTELIREGYAWVGVSAQYVGVEGGSTAIPGLGGLFLKGYNPARYFSLSHPGDSFSYDVFSQAAQAVRHPLGIDPLEGLKIKRIIAMGESQSAFRLVTYVNGVHSLVQLFDGFLIHSRGGTGASLSQAPQSVLSVPAGAQIRGDLAEPVLTFQTETDLISLGSLAARQKDSANFRLWEVAGTAHADTYSLIVGADDTGDSPDMANVIVNSKPIPGIIECGSPINSGPQHFVLDAAIAALDVWVRGGEAPPRAPWLEVAGEPAAYVLDEHGNARGGIRTSWVDVPVARLSGLGQTGASFCGIFGTTIPFDAAYLRALYPSHAVYVDAVTASTEAALAAGFLREADAILIIEAAVQSDIGG